MTSVPTKHILCITYNIIYIFHIYKYISDQSDKSKCFKLCPGTRKIVKFTIRVVGFSCRSSFPVFKLSTLAPLKS